MYVSYNGGKYKEWRFIVINVKLTSYYLYSKTMDEDSEKKKYKERWKESFRDAVISVILSGDVSSL